jgi:NTP pyrophosphatase (non-canonical NTP hydrolase)
MGYMTNGVTFNVLRGANRNRQKEWPGNEQADVAFRALEVAGEAGELCEKVKKFLRAERGIKGSTATRDDIAAEMGDLMVSLDLLADALGIDLGDATRAKFNGTSEKYGMRTYIGSDGDWHLYPEAETA